MPSRCASPIKGTALRIVQLDACGVPTTGSSLVVVSAGFIKVEMEPQYEDGQEFTQRNAAGDLCVNEKDAPTLKRLGLTIDFCNVDPNVPTLVAGTRLITTSPGATGSGFALAEGTPGAHFSLEVWQRVAGSGACDASGLPYYIYNAWPHVKNGKLGNYSIENGSSTLQLVAETAAPSLTWGNGPGNGTSWLPGSVQALEHWLWNISTGAPPTDACGTSTLT